MIRKIYKIIKNTGKKLTPVNNSKDYWEVRYKKNGNSGSGSYGMLAEFKSQVINKFVKDNKIRLIGELGCGDGNQLLSAKYIQYVGLDVSETAVNLCREKFKDDTSKTFYLLNNTITIPTVELMLSLDVIYHLIEDDVFHRYMSDLFNHSSRYVVIYSSNFNKLTAAHVRHRKFTKWVKEHQSSNWKFIKKIDNKFPYDKNKEDDTSRADFYFYQKTT